MEGPYGQSWSVANDEEGDQGAADTGQVEVLGTAESRGEVGVFKSFFFGFF